MVKKASGNRTPREKLPPEKKSRLVQFRLDPKDTNDAWLLDFIQRRESEGETLRQLFARLARADANAAPIEPVVIASAEDVLDIKQVVQYIMDRIDSGDFGRTSGRRKKQEPEIQISSAARAMLDRHIAGGLLGDDDDE